MENWSLISLCILLALTARWAVSFNSYSGWWLVQWIKTAQKINMDIKPLVYGLKKKFFFIKMFF